MLSQVGRRADRDLRRHWSFSFAEAVRPRDRRLNLTRCNFPIGHPRREMHDTFYFIRQGDGSRMPALRTPHLPR